MKRKIVSLNTVKINDWLFKSSESGGNILIVAYNMITHTTSARFFLSDAAAHEWVEYLLLQAKSGSKSIT